DSVRVSQSFNKNHYDVLRDIRNILASVSGDWGVRNFAETHYTHPQNGQNYPMYLMTEEGFTILVMGYTGQRAMDFKVQYINEFHRMRNQLTQPQLPQNYKEALVALLEKVEENEKIQGENKMLQERIAADLPKVHFAESLVVSKDAILVGELAKLLKQNGIDIGETRLFQYLRENGYLIKSGSERNLPTQRSMEMKLFEIKVGQRGGTDG